MVLGHGLEEALGESAGDGSRSWDNITRVSRQTSWHTSYSQLSIKRMGPQNVTAVFVKRTISNVLNREHFENRVQGSCRVISDFVPRHALLRSGCTDLITHKLRRSSHTMVTEGFISHRLTYTLPQLAGVCVYQTLWRSVTNLWPLRVWSPHKSPPVPSCVCSFWQISPSRVWYHPQVGPIT